jgi:Arc/MetJ-type ribon-helix-helix transcriptional regulator
MRCKRRCNTNAYKAREVSQIRLAVAVTVAMTPRTVRFGKDLDDRITRTAKERGFTSVSAFLRTAIENEIRHRGGAAQHSEDRAAASMERVSSDIRRLATGQQALFAFVDALAKTVLTCMPEPSGDEYQQAIARARARYDRFLKSVGAGLSGEAGKAFLELSDRAER